MFRHEKLNSSFSSLLLEGVSDLVDVRDADVARKVREDGSEVDDIPVAVGDDRVRRTASEKGDREVGPNLNPSS